MINDIIYKKSINQLLENKSINNKYRYFGRRMDYNQSVQVATRIHHFLTNK